MHLSAIDELGRRQHGVVSAAQLLEAGNSRKRVRGALERGSLIILHRGVYRIAGSPETLHQTWMAAVLAAGEGALLSHRTAVQLWGLPRPLEAPIELVSEVYRRHRHHEFVAHETNDLPACDRWMVNGIPVTAIERTLIDVGRYAREYRVGEWLDHAVRLGFTSYDRFRTRVLELARPGRNGIGTAKRVLKDRGYGDGFGFERLMRGILRDAGLPDPVKEWPVRIGAKTYFIDFGYPDQGIGIECDSSQWHTLPHQIDHDLRRQNHIVSQGILLLRYSYHTARTQPWLVAEEVRAQLLQRSAWLAER